MQNDFMETHKAQLMPAAQALLPELIALSDALYERPELGYEEFFACEQHTALLERHGFAVERNCCDLPTAYSAVFDSGKPGLTVAFLAEYDALPGIGHGCGHNLLGAASLGAGILLAQMLEQTGGKVIVFGTPAEETSGAKVRFARAGKFDSVDLAMLSHPTSSAWRRSGSSLALQPLQFEFFGKTAHAASHPWDGINALDAALVAMTAINALREHIRPDSRVHGIIVEGGQAANIVPEYCKVQYYIRSTTKSYNTILTKRIQKCAEAGALATGCRVEFSEFEAPYDNLITNQALMDVFDEALYALRGIHLAPADQNMGSTDMGQVSQACPAIHPYFDIANGTPANGHSRELAACTRTPYAYESMRDAACAMVLTALRVLQDPELYARIRAEFEAAEK